ncbi:MAG: glycosyltransferase [Actinobacteria bacterium]|nr:glycosyltransferase [Actinomycetota bacterium]
MRRVSLMSDSLVSIVIPTFNRAEHLKRALTSVLTQTLVEIEVLVIDDGSTDHTREVLGQFHDSRLSIEYLNENSGGPAAPRNIGIWKASGKWIAFLDSDDWWEPNHLENQLLALERSGLRAACGNAYNFASLGAEPEVGPTDFSMCTTHHAVLPDQVDLAQLLQWNLIVTSSVVMLREDAIRAEGFSSHVKGPVFEDYALWLRVATLTNFVVSDEVTVHYQTDSPDSHGDTNQHGDAMRNTFLELQTWLHKVKLSTDE